VQQTVVPAGGTGIDVPFFNQNAGNTSKGQIPGQAGSRGPAADDQYVGLNGHE
jgi:hypothetical protein